MDYLIANVDHVFFKIEEDLDQQYGTVPFPGMDKSTAAVCLFYNQADGTDGCEKGASCPFRHIRGDRTIVCKHWLRGLCKKGDQCEFLHEFDMTKMPECYFYSRFNACHNKECPFLHIDPESKIKDCPWYDRGFCRHGPSCRHRHVRRVLCMNYLAGFCPQGAECKYMHPRFELPPPPESKDGIAGKKPPVCHYCAELGHKASYCPKMPPEQREVLQRQEEAKYKALGYLKQGLQPPPPEDDLSRPPPAQRPPPRPLEEITCFKCGNKGHYANKCPKGLLAFLSQASNRERQQMEHQRNQNNRPL
ncbi:cleavage and polyadenylation specificity factor subunit 4 [Culicoides brevitarsis]|uniref:cleavage and polyadenylation specificity factor subunit 4 n=1 Tax=Culicoides brevitarsis TaxID=469753 RepID=UPI00307B9ED7